MADPRTPPDFAMDPNDLWSEEVITDRRVGSLRMMHPILPDGAPDPQRPTLFVGEAQMMTNVGPLPITFEIEAASLAEAVGRYGEAARAALERTVRELQDMRRQAASGLVLPGQGSFGAAGVPPGLGGGKIQMP